MNAPSYQPIAVLPFTEGIRTDLPEFIIPDDAATQMVNISQFRGKLIEKGGDVLLASSKEGNFRSRLGVRNYSATTDGSGKIIAGTSFLSEPLSPGTIIITQGLLQAIDSDNGDGTGSFVEYNSSGWAGSGTINYLTGSITVDVTGFSPSTSYSVYMIRQPDSKSPAMGAFAVDQESSSLQELIAFDTQKPYVFDAIADRFELEDSYQTSNAKVTFTGSDSDYFWGVNYSGGFWVSNGLPGFKALQNVQTVTPGTPTTIEFSGNHGLSNNDWVFLWDLGGIDLDETSGQVTVVNPTTITVNVTSSGTWSSGGTVQVITRNIGSGDGLLWHSTTGWHNYAPPITGDQNTSGTGGSAQYLMGAKLIIAYKGYLVFLGTYEGTSYATRQYYPYRARWTQTGTPYYASPVPSNQSVFAKAAYEGKGLGGFENAPIQEDIIAAAFIRDDLVVKFETYTLRLDYTGNAADPFVWSRVNDDFGAQSKHSIISEDKTIKTASQDAFTAGQGIDENEFDQKVQDLIYQMGQEDDNRKRVYGYRNKVSRQLVWGFFSPQATPSTLKFPNREVVFNYVDQTWSTRKVYRTCYCQFQSFFSRTWARAKRTWASSNFPWNSLQSKRGNRISVAGNSQGFFHILSEQQISNQSYNDRQFCATSVNMSGQLVVPNHVFQLGDFVRITGFTGDNAQYNGNVYSVRFISSSVIELRDAKDGKVELTPQAVASGFVESVDNFVWRGKKFYIGGNEGKQVRLGYLDLFFESQNVESYLTVKIYIDDETDTNLVFRLPLKTSEPAQGKVMRRIYPNIQAQSFQVEFTYDTEEMFDFDTGYKQFVLYGYTPYVEKAGRIINGGKN